MKKHRKIINLIFIFAIFAQNICFAAEQAVQPPAQDGFGFIVLKFVSAMAGVLLSAGAIFFGLKLYKKFVLKNDTKIEESVYNSSLESPKDLKEAINIFLDKTEG